MKRRLKIAILIDQLVPGGVQKSAIREAKELTKLGHQIKLFVLVKLKYEYQFEDLLEGLKVDYLSDLNPIGFRHAIRIPYFAFLTNLHILNPVFVSRYHILKKYDFIISHGTTTCITAAAISRKWKVPYLAFIWDPMLFILEKVYGKTPLRYIFPLLKRLILHVERGFLLTAAIVATSSRVHQSFLQRIYSINPLVIYPGIIPQSKIPSKTGNYILGYSRWETAKSPHFFFLLAKKFTKARFLLAGSWTNSQAEEDFKKDIKQNGLTAQIRLISPITNKDLPKIAQNSLVWVHPHFEAFGMSGLEMAALGLPIIIPKGSGLSEIFTHAKEGFFPDLFDEQTITRYLHQLLSHPEIARRMGKQAAKTANKYSWKYHTLLLHQKILTYVTQTKIIAISNAFVARFSIGGGDRFLIESAKRVPDNVHLTIILPDVGYYHFQNANVDKLNIRYILLPSNLFDENEKIVPLFFAYLIRALQTTFLLNNLPQFTVLHTATDFFPDVIPAFIYRVFHPNIKWVARFFHFYELPWKRHGSILRNTGSYLLQRVSLKLLKKTDLVILDNQLLKSEITSHLLRSTRIEVCAGGVDGETIKQAKSNRKYSSTALFIGRLSAHKGVYDAIEVWRIVIRQFPQFRLTLLGYNPPWETKKIKNKIENLGLTQQIRLTGFIKDREIMFQYLHSTKVFLFLDHEAGFGLVAAEAMAAGLPVISYDLPIFGTVYKKGYITAKLRNTQEVSELVIKLLTDNEMYKDISAKARVQAKQFDWNMVSRRFYKFLTSV